jgi:hypothetical protein
VLHEELQREMAADSIPVLSSQAIPKVLCRLMNYEPVTALKNLKANYYGESLSCHDFYP